MVYALIENDEFKGFFLNKEEGKEYVEITNEDHMELLNGQSNGKVICYKENKIITEETKVSRENLIKLIKNELENLKEAKILLGVEVKEGIYHPARDTDKINLIIAKSTIQGEQSWKYYDINHEPILDVITVEIIDTILYKGAKLLNGAIIGETKAEENLTKLTDEELKDLDVEAYFEKYYKENGGI